MELLTWFAATLNVSCREKRYVIGKKKKTTTVSRRCVWIHYASLSSEKLMCCYLWGYMGNRMREQEVHGDTFTSPSTAQTQHCANGHFSSSHYNTESMPVWARFCLNDFIKSMHKHDCVCMSVFMCRTTINCTWICLWVFTSVYDSFSEFVHFAGFVCDGALVCVCVCLSLQLCMHTRVYASIMASLFPSVCVGVCNFCQHDPFARSELNLSCWTQTAVKKTTQCFLSWHLQRTSDYTIMVFFVFSFVSLASLMWPSEWSPRTDSVSRWSCQSLPELDWFN